MYIVGQKVKKPKKRYKILKNTSITLVIIGIIAALVWFFAWPKLQKNNPAVHLVPTNFAVQGKRHISEPYYEFDLPDDWKESSRTTAPLKEISWIGTAREAIARKLDIYLDTIPVTVAVNRMVPVSGQGNQLSVGEMSGNCVQFTGDAAKLTPLEASKSKVALTKWEGVPFLCDIPNELRNVIGAASPEGLNKVSVAGDLGGKHAYFFVYTDHTAHPDDKAFTEILRSFRAR